MCVAFVIAYVVIFVAVLLLLLLSCHGGNVEIYHRTRCMRIVSCTVKETITRVHYFFADG